MSQLLNGATWKTLEKRWDALGFAELQQNEQETIALFWLEAEVMNGGFDQYFWNSSGDLLPQACSGLQRLGMPITLGLVDQAITAFCVGPYPVDRTQRHGELERAEATSPERYVAAIEAATRGLQDLPERFLEAAVADLAQTYARLSASP